MAANDTASMALFCDFENIALGVRDAQYEKFDIRPVLERLLAKGSIVVKKAYCDWERYKSFKAAMHEANFELIEIPHVRQSGKNSADIRMVVDALDLCYTKSHVDTFVIISGDSDFSPLVSKLRENAKKVIGVGVKQSCSDLLVTNCDEFIYYDDLVRDREAQRGGQRREREKRSPEEEARRTAKMEERKAKAIELVSATFVDLMADRGEAERIWASVLKEVVKRRNPGFSESYYGFRTFGNLLEEAAVLGLLAVGRDEKSGTYVTRARSQEVMVAADAFQEQVPEDVTVETVTDDFATPEPQETDTAIAPLLPAEKPAGRRRGGRRTRKDTREGLPVGSGDLEAVVGTPAIQTELPVTSTESSEVAEQVVPENPVPLVVANEKPRRGRRPRKPAAEAAVESSVDTAAVAVPVLETPLADAVAGSKKRVARSRTTGKKTTEKKAEAKNSSANEVVEKKPARSRKPKKASDAGDDAAGA